MTLLHAIALAVTASGAPNGPSDVELVAALGAAPRTSGPVSFRMDTIRSVRCRAFDEEPTEYRCRFKAWDAEGRWKLRSAIVAQDKEGWVLLSLN